MNQYPIIELEITSDLDVLLARLNDIAETVTFPVNLSFYGSLRLMNSKDALLGFVMGMRQMWQILYERNPNCSDTKDDPAVIRRDYTKIMEITLNSARTNRVNIIFDPILGQYCVMSVSPGLVHSQVTVQDLDSAIQALMSAITDLAEFETRRQRNVCGNPNFPGFLPNNMYSALGRLVSRGNDCARGMLAVLAAGR